MAVGYWTACPPVEMRGKYGNVTRDTKILNRIAVKFDCREEEIECYLACLVKVPQEEGQPMYKLKYRECEVQGDLASIHMMWAAMEDYHEVVKPPIEVFDVCGKLISNPESYFKERLCSSTTQAKATQKQ